MKRPEAAAIAATFVAAGIPARLTFDGSAKHTVTVKLAHESRTIARPDQADAVRRWALAEMKAVAS